MAIAPLDSNKHRNDDRPWVWTRRELGVLIAIVLTAVGVRWGLIGRSGVRLDDPDGYLRLARSVARGDGLRINGRLTAYRPPLYPILLAPIVQACDGPGLPLALTALHLILGAGSVIFVADLARRIGLGRDSVWIAATITAVDPVLVAQARSVMTETPAALIVAGTLWGLALPGCRGSIVAGLGFGLAALCRPSLLPAGLMTALAGLIWCRGSTVERVQRSSLLLITTGLILTPWMIRNTALFGEPIATTTHGGYTLALANNAAYYSDVLDGPPGSVWSGPNQDAWFDSINRAAANRGEPEADRRLRGEALAFARAHPWDFARASWARLGRFWGVMPSSAVYSGTLRAITAAWTVPLWSLTLVGLATRRFRNWPGVAALALIVSLTLIHLIYWTDLRMRAPLVPAIAMIAALGWSGVRDWRWGRAGFEQNRPMSKC